MVYLQFNEYEEKVENMTNQNNENESKGFPGLYNRIAERPTRKLFTDPDEDADWNDWDDGCDGKT
jgi:hypothetical protein